MDGAPACPFVAFGDDRDGRSTSPDHRHRCFAESPPAPRARRPPGGLLPVERLPGLPDVPGLGEAGGRPRPRCGRTPRDGPVRDAGRRVARHRRRRIRAPTSPGRPPRHRPDPTIRRSGATHLVTGRHPRLGRPAAPAVHPGRPVPATSRPPNSWRPSPWRGRVWPGAPQIGWPAATRRSPQPGGRHRRPARHRRRPMTTWPVSCRAVRPVRRRPSPRRTAIRPRRAAASAPRSARPARPATRSRAHPGSGCAATRPTRPSGRVPGSRACHASSCWPGRSGSRHSRCSCCRRCSASAAEGRPAHRPARVAHPRPPFRARPSSPAPPRRSTSSRGATRCRRSRRSSRSRSRTSWPPTRTSRIPNVIALGQQIIIPVATPGEASPSATAKASAKPSAKASKAP